MNGNDLVPSYDVFEGTIILIDNQDDFKGTIISTNVSVCQ